MKTYRIETINDILTIPCERRQEFFKELELTCALHDLAFGEEVEAPLKAIVWTDDGNSSISVQQSNGEQLLKLEVVKA